MIKPQNTINTLQKHQLVAKMSRYKFHKLGLLFLCHIITKSGINL